MRVHLNPPDRRHQGWEASIPFSHAPAAASRAQGASPRARVPPVTDIETAVLDRLIPDPLNDLPSPGTLSLYLTKIARLGGYLARAKDPPPGNIVMWAASHALTT